MDHNIPSIPYLKKEHTVQSICTVYCLVVVVYHFKHAFVFIYVGVRMLDGDMTDVVEAQSLSLRQQYIDIYSSSWGPDDDGRMVDGPGPLARLALESGVRKVSVFAYTIWQRKLPKLY